MPPLKPMNACWQKEIDERVERRMQRQRYEIGAAWAFMAVLTGMIWWAVYAMAMKIVNMWW